MALFPGVYDGVPVPSGKCQMFFVEFVEKDVTTPVDDSI